jgi:hypothetical protein
MITASSVRDRIVNVTTAREELVVTAAGEAF